VRTGPSATERVRSAVDDVTPTNDPAGDTPSDILGTARGVDEPGPLSGVADRVPDNAPAGDTPSDILGTARGVDEPGPLSAAADRLPSNAPAGDTPSDIFGTAPRAGSISDLTPRIGDPDRPRGGMTPLDDTPDADTSGTSAGGATIDVDTDANPGQASGTSQITQLRLDRRTRTQADTGTQQRGGLSGAPAGAPAGIAISDRNDPTGIATTPTPGSDDANDPTVITPETEPDTDIGGDGGSGLGGGSSTGTLEEQFVFELLREETGLRGPVDTAQPPATASAARTGTRSVSESTTDTASRLDSPTRTDETAIGATRLGSPQRSATPPRSPRPRTPPEVGDESDADEVPLFGTESDADLFDSGILSAEDVLGR